MSAQDKVLDGAGLAVVNQIIGDKLDKKQDKLAAGDGTTVAGNKVNVTTPVQGIYTQAEYDALPEEQKNKGMYVIPDAGGVAGGGSSGEIYSTEETRIGTWIDGMPLYKRTLVGTFSHPEEAILTNVNVCVSSNGFLGIGGSTNCDLMIPYMSSGGYVSVLVNRSTHTLILYSRYSDCIGQQFAVTAEYTKTTDLAPAQEVTE